MRKQTGVTHTADANKRQASSQAHTTDALKRIVGSPSHSTNALLNKTTSKTHTTDSRLRSDSEASISKNAPLYLSIGNGLSAIVGYPRISTWNTLGRPASPKTGMVGFNHQTGKLEIWNGSLWYSVSMTEI